MIRFEGWSRLGLTLTIAMLAGGCGRSTPASAQERADPPAASAPHQRQANDVARFLAGLPGNEGSPFTALEMSDTWQQHRHALDQAWGKAEAALISGLRSFQKEELRGVAADAPVFYPFGGPDALTATLCFPDNPLYVVVGLEPVGTLPAPEQLEKKDLPKFLAEVRQTMASELGRSFFVTREMDRQFRGQVTDGLLLPILHLLVRTNHTILGLRLVRLDENGNLVERAESEKVPSRFGNKGIEIQFQTDADRSIHKLLYIAANLSDQWLRQNRPFVTYASRLKPAVTLFKATSYMMHKPDFSIIRDLVLADSSAILQDDSGIPYRYLQSDVWKVQLYGEYDRPYGSFRWLQQSDLRQAYQSLGPKPLSLRIGYGYARVASNLLLARRSSAIAALPPTQLH